MWEDQENIELKDRLSYRRPFLYHHCPQRTHITKLSHLMLCTEFEANLDSQRDPEFKTQNMLHQYINSNNNEPNIKHQLPSKLPVALCPMLP